MCIILARFPFTLFLSFDAADHVSRPQDASYCAVLVLLFAIVLQPPQHCICFGVLVCVVDVRVHYWWYMIKDLDVPKTRQRARAQDAAEK